ncbi:MAG TPA: M48 family metalloprotease [Woeseiaceae bacterium]|nr:M48 family metalloprotease [Woeseiaceae bacterium]
MRNMFKPIASMATVCLLASGCSVNPVTGDRELILISEQQELKMGEQAYFGAQQSQGGIYDVDPALTSYVSEVGQRLAAVSDRDLPYEFVVLNNSVPNAWALPGGKIAINRGLLTELNSEAELAAVLGHEIVHAAARHSAQQQSRGMLSQALVLATAVVASDSDYGGLAVGGAGLAAQLANATYGRSAELESDKYGMEYMSRAGYDPEGAVQLQETFVRLNDDRKSDWLSGLFASHPPSPERVAANRATAASLPQGGKVGADVYQLKMQKTLAAKPAYDAYDKGREALADDKVKEALKLANQAIESFPAEANFYALRGDVRFKEKDYSAAIKNYNSAIDRRDDFFYYPLQRGLAKNRLGDQDGAEQDLERSIELMPTAPAIYALGGIAEKRGNIDTAIQRYKVVAGAGGEYGQAAQGSLARLEIPRNPAAYFAQRCDADSRGNLIVSVQNRAGVEVSNVVIEIDLTDNAGRVHPTSREISGRLEPGQVVQVNTGLGPYSGTACPVRVVSARLP